MPTVISEALVNAPLEKVYAVAKDVAVYPEFMEDVDSIEILEKTPERQVSKWVGNIKEFNRKIRWTEEDFWNDEEHTCFFQQTEGDFSLYKGTWAFKEQDGGTVATLTLEYDYNVPLIGNLIKGLLKKKTQANTDGIVSAIKMRAESV
jgi:ribosome-associated toxin RatA of RatAB toxin-antitoxin module